MKIFVYILLALAAILVIYNSTMLDFGHLLEGDSKVAVISILAGFCAILLLVILLVSFRIKEQNRQLRRKEQD